MNIGSTSRVFWVCSSKLKGTGLESRPVRMFVIEVVQIQCSKVFEVLECAGLVMIMCTIKNTQSHLIRVGRNPDFTDLVFATDLGSQ